MDLGAIGSLHSHCFSGRGRGTFLPEARSKGPRRCLQKSKRKLQWHNRKRFVLSLKLTRLRGTSAAETPAQARSIGEADPGPEEH